MKTKRPNPALLDIDLYHLETEWQEQPKLFNEWAQELAQARSDVNHAKQQLEYVEAELRNAIRIDPEAYGLAKATDKPVADAVVIQDAYQTAYTQYNAARHKQGQLEAMVSALDQRKKALENEVSLFGQQYFALPRGPREGRERMEQAGKTLARKKGVKKRD